MAAGGKTPQELTGEILDKNRDLIIVCDEIGCGLVPTDAFERRIQRICRPHLYGTCKICG